MDRGNGKRPLPSDESKEKEDDHIFPVFSARSQEDMSAMVSALSQVIRNTQNDPHQLYQNPNLTTSSSVQSNTTQQDQSQRVEDQGIIIYQLLIGCYPLCL